MRLLAFAAMLALAGCASAPVAQRPAIALKCFPRAALVAGLAREFSERPRWIGVVDDTKAVELLIGPNSWTLVITRPNGMSCPLLAGQYWRQATPKGDGA